MTAQINDTFRYHNELYDIAAIQFPEDFFDIERLAITPEATNTACWRGYVAGFSLQQNKLVLHTLDTNNSNGKATPVAINDIMPEIVKPDGLVDDYKQFRKWYYRDINLVIPYSGSILITNEFIEERYVHMGFQSPLSYHQVIELTFTGGSFVKENDLSQTAAMLRETQQLESREEQLARLPVWICECFDLSYKTKWDF